MSYKAPAIGQTGKTLSFIISASGTGGTGAWTSSDNDATAIQWDTSGNAKYMKVTDDGTPSGNIVTIPNNVRIIRTAIQYVEEFKGYNTYSDGGTTGSSLNTPYFSSSTPAGVYVGTTWADASAVTSQTASSAGTAIGNFGIPAFGLTGGYSLGMANPFSSSGSFAAATYSMVHDVVITTGGSLSIGYACSTYDHYGSAANATENGRLAQGKYVYTIKFVEL
jgi:hypothetical protein